MRVVLAQYEGIDATPVLPLAAGCLVATARLHPALATVDFHIAIERQPIPQAVQSLQNPAVLGLSLYPWNAAYSLAVAQAARAEHPRILIVAGGPSVPRRHERALKFFHDHPYVDILAFGEGELLFRDLLLARQNNTPYDAIPGLAIRHADATVTFSPDPVRITDLSQTASPFLDGTFDDLLQKHPGRFNMVLCETNRGCPFSCTFCDWSLTKKVAEFPLDRVHAELDWVVTHGFSHLMFADANFGIRPRDISIAHSLVTRKQTHGAPATFYFYLTKNNHARNLQTIEILQDGGIGTWVGLAVQDFDEDVLEAVKRDNIQTGEAQILRRICADRGIPTFNELILGLPGQTYQSFVRTMAEAMPPLPRHDFVLFLCRLIDNAELGAPESRQRYGIQTRRCQWKTSTPNWDPVIDEHQEVVVATADMPPADWLRTFRLSFFAAALYNLRLLRVVLQHIPDATSHTLETYLELLADHLTQAPPGSVYAGLSAILDRYANSLLSSGPFVLPSAPGGPPIVVEDALATLAYSRYPEFLAETQALTPNGLAEAFRYQQFITPRWGRPEPVHATFQHDWPAYTSGGPLTPEPVEIRFTPLATTIDTHIACIRARLLPGKLERLTAPIFTVL